MPANDVTVGALPLCLQIPGLAIVGFDPVRIDQGVHIDGITLSTAYLLTNRVVVVSDISITTIQADVDVGFKFFEPVTISTLSNPQML